MPLWGKGANNNYNKPQWLAYGPYPYGAPADAFANTYASNTGWMFLKGSSLSTNHKELLVAISNLANDMGNANITQCLFQTGAPQVLNVAPTLVSNANGNVVVIWDKRVLWIGANTPTLNLTQTGAIKSNIVATYQSGNGTNQLVFAFQTPRDFQGNTVANTILTVANTPIFAGPGANQIFDWSNTALISSLVINPAGWQFPFGNVNPTCLITHNCAGIINVTTDHNPLTHSTLGNLFVNFSDTIKVWGDLPNSANIFLTSSNGGFLLKANYVSGNNSTNLKFGFTAPANTTNLSINTGVTMNTLLVFADGQNAASNLFITVTAASTTGNVNVV